MHAFVVPLRVPGEDLPWVLGPSLLAVGTACALAIGNGWEEPNISAPSHPTPAVAVVETPPPVEAPAPAQPQVEPEPPPDEPIEAPPSPPEPVEPPPTDEAEPVVIDSPEPAVDCAPSFSMTFAVGSAEPESHRHSRLAALVSWLNAHPEARAAVEGHASSEGSEVVNLQLSHRRARHVATLLRQRGIGKQRLAVQAFGEYRPDLQGEGPDADRRVTVRVIDHPQCDPQEPR